MVVSALLPSQQPNRSGRLARSTSRPTTVWGPPRRSLEYPTRLRASSSSVRRYRVVTSYRHGDRSPAVVAHASAAAATVCPRSRSTLGLRDPAAPDLRQHRQPDLVTGRAGAPRSAAARAPWPRPAPPWPPGRYGPCAGTDPHPRSYRPASAPQHPPHPHYSSEKPPTRHQATKTGTSQARGPSPPGGCWTTTTSPSPPPT